MKLYLASTSPRRRELLQQLEIPFEIITPRFEEAPTDLSPEQEARLFAQKKAESVAAACPGSFIIASDTIVAFNQAKLGKPRDAEHARAMLSTLSGQTHSIFTAVVLLNTRDNTAQSHVEQAKVTFRTLSTEEIDTYVASGEPLDKAGAYAIQGGAKEFAVAIEGELNSIIGLPLNILREWLLK